MSEKPKAVGYWDQGEDAYQAGLEAAIILSRATTACMDAVTDRGRWLFDFNQLRVPEPPFDTFQAMEAYRMVVNARERLLGFRR